MILQSTFGALNKSLWENLLFQVPNFFHFSVIIWLSEYGNEGDKSYSLLVEKLVDL